MGITVTQEDFIKRSNTIHNNKYDYSKTIYVKASEKVIITCPIHGDFEQTPNNHFAGKGCPNCGTLRTSTSKVITNDERLISTLQK